MQRGSGRGALVENRHAAECASVPFCVVFLKLWVDRFEKRPNEGNLHNGTRNGSLVADVRDCRELVGAFAFTRAEPVGARRHTLIIRNSSHQQHEGNRPSIDTLEQPRHEALGGDTDNLCKGCICSGRGIARVQRHCAGKATTRAAMLCYAIGICSKCRNLYGHGWVANWQAVIIVNVP